jgi:hypothetical protein
VVKGSYLALQTENLRYGKITKDTKTETENQSLTLSLCGLRDLSVLWRITQRDAFTPGFSIRLRPARRAAER